MDLDKLRQELDSITVEDSADVEPVESSEPVQQDYSVKNSLPVTDDDRLREIAGMEPEVDPSISREYEQISLLDRIGGFAEGAVVGFTEAGLALGNFLGLPETDFLTGKTDPESLAKWKATRTQELKDKYGDISAITFGDITGQIVAAAGPGISAAKLAGKGVTALAAGQQSQNALVRGGAKAVEVGQTVLKGAQPGMGIGARFGARSAQGFAGGALFSAFQNPGKEETLSEKGNRMLFSGGTGAVFMAGGGALFDSLKGVGRMGLNAVSPKVKPKELATALADKLNINLESISGSERLAALKAVSDKRNKLYKQAFNEKIPMVKAEKVLTQKHAMTAVDDIIRELAEQGDDFSRKGINSIDTLQIIKERMDDVVDAGWQGTKAKVGNITVPTTKSAVKEWAKQRDLLVATMSDSSKAYAKASNLYRHELIAASKKLHLLPDEDLVNLAKTRDVIVKETGKENWLRIVGDDMKSYMSGADQTSAGAFLKMLKSSRRRDIYRTALDVADNQDMLQRFDVLAQIADDTYLTSATNLNSTLQAGLHRGPILSAAKMILDSSGKDVDRVLMKALTSDLNKMAGKTVKDKVANLIILELAAEINE